MLSPSLLSIIPLYYPSIILEVTVGCGYNPSVLSCLTDRCPDTTIDERERQLRYERDYSSTHSGLSHTHVRNVFAGNGDLVHSVQYTHSTVIT